MTDKPRRLRIGVMAPANRIDPVVADRVKTIAADHFGAATPDIHFHQQCYRSAGHFAGDDATRLAAFVEMANDPDLDAIWFAKGGYGCCRIAEGALSRLEAPARDKTYLGYSDTGAFLAALYGTGIGRVAHGPMPADAMRADGATPILRALDYLMTANEATLEPSISRNVPSVAFNLTILASIMGTPLQPDLDGHVLMLEEVSEHMYRIDRMMFTVTSHPAMRGLAGIRLGRCSDVPPNDPDFVVDQEHVFRDWCARSGIPYLGPADIGHDSANKIVPFGFSNQAKVG